MKNNKREGWLDSLRGIGMFFVVWGHCFSNLNNSIRKAIYSFHMPFFFFLSGLNSEKDLQLSTKEFIKKKCNSLLIPYLILNVISLIIFKVLVYFGIRNDISFINLLKGIFFSNQMRYNWANDPTWFIMALFLTQILFYFLKKISRDDMDLFLLTLICSIIGYLNGISKFEKPGLWHIESIFMAVFMYFLGYIFMKNIDKFKELFNNKLKSFILMIILILIAMFYIKGNQKVSLNANHYGAILNFYFSCFSCIFALILFSKLLLNKIYLLRKIGEYSLFYLVYHYFVINIYMFYFPFFDSGEIGRLILTILVCIILFPFALISYKKFPIFIGKTKLFRIK